MIFCMKINIKVFYKLVVSFLLVIARHAQGAQNSRFVILLQYLKKEGRNEGDFYMQINFKLSYKLIPLILVSMIRPANITQNKKFAKSLQYLKKELKLRFNMLINMKNIYK